jgi:hypothetical protein
LPTMSNGKSPENYLSRTLIDYQHQMPSLNQLLANISPSNAQHD